MANWTKATDCDHEDDLVLEIKSSWDLMKDFFKKNRRLTNDLTANHLEFRDSNFK